MPSCRDALPPAGHSSSRPRPPVPPSPRPCTSLLAGPTRSSTSPSSAPAAAAAHNLEPGRQREHRRPLRRRSSRQSAQGRGRSTRRRSKFTRLPQALRPTPTSSTRSSSARTEHTHAFATLPALQLGKHVYCEKPLTHNIREARVIREAAAKAKVATQMGTQIHASDNYRRVVELIQTGAIGPVTRSPRLGLARLGPAIARGRARRTSDIVSASERPKERRNPVPPPASTGTCGSGPAPTGRSTRSMSRAEVVPLVGLRQRHHVRPGQPLERPAVLGTEARMPRRPSKPTARRRTRRSPRRRCRPTYEYGPRGDLPPVTLDLVSGRRTSPSSGPQKKIPQWANGVLFIGDKGMLLADYGKHIAAAGEGVRRLQAAASRSIPKSHRPPRRVDPRLQDRLADDLQLRLRRLADRGEPSGQRRLPGRQEAGVGRRSHAGTQLPRGRRFIRREYRKGWKLV